jgi:hypothetical protein
VNGNGRVKKVRELCLQCQGKSQQQKIAVPAHEIFSPFINADLGSPVILLKKNMLESVSGRKYEVYGNDN